ncbi:MAG: PAS domain S-box protein, partial [Bdellovibrionales bacterium]|nr:PAS domain S-box protein [Bdellovibrionales bacterium]
TNQELLGLSIEILVPERYRGPHAQMRADFCLEPKKRLMGVGRELYGLRKDGSEFPVAIGLNPIEIDGELFVLSSVIDNSERARILQELKHQHEEMQSLLYTVSHDLKAPLVTIEGFAGIMADALKSGDIDVAMDSSERISKATQVMRSLIGDILELVRVGSLELTLDRVDIEEVLDRVENVLLAELQEKSVSVVREMRLPIVFSDASRISQIFTNLIGNAIKYGVTKQDTNVYVGVEEAPQAYHFYVRDCGQGISPEHHKKIFTLFYRANTTEIGSGVGLAIVAKAARSLGGQTWLDSTSGGGSTFWFSIAKETRERQGEEGNNGASTL